MSISSSGATLNLTVRSPDKVSTATVPPEKRTESTCGLTKPVSKYRIRCGGCHVGSEGEMKDGCCEIWEDMVSIRGIYAVIGVSAAIEVWG